MTTPAAGVQHGPISKSDRIESIDVLRGFALLGILIMNIQSFSMPFATYSDPSVWGDLTGANRWVWILSHVFADQKFMTLFSALFGAGIVIMWERAEAKGIGATWVHYRRTFWLGVIGATHAYLIWTGDILFLYAICGSLVYWMRKWKPKTLFIVGSLILLIPPALILAATFSMPYWPEEDRAQLLATFAPSAAALAAEIQAMQGGWSEQLPVRISTTLGFHIGTFPMWAFWRAGGLMLFGMALYKLGFMRAALPESLYKRGFVGGLIVGTVLSGYGVWRSFSVGWGVEAFFPGNVFNYFGSLASAFGYACMIVLAMNQGWFARLRAPFTAVGRSALSNYLLQTAICTTIFYGHGFGLFSEVERVGQAGIVLAVWAFQVVASVWWMNRFRFGPMEWLWRSATYWKLQPMRKLG